MDRFIVPLFGFGVGMAVVAGWLTHIAICFQADRWGFLIAGAILPPIAVIHGWGNWFGWW